MAPARAANQALKQQRPSREDGGLQAGKETQAPREEREQQCPREVRHAIARETQGADGALEVLRWRNLRPQPSQACEQPEPDDGERAQAASTPRLEGDRSQGR